MRLGMAFRPVWRRSTYATKNRSLASHHGSLIVTRIDLSFYLQLQVFFLHIIQNGSHHFVVEFAKILNG